MKATPLIAASLALALTGAIASAQQAQPPAQPKPGADVDKLIELARKDVRGQKADIIAKTMELDAAAAAAFWPVYKLYEAERTKLSDEKLAIIKDYAQAYNTKSVTDEKAKELLARSQALEDKFRALEKKNADEMLKVLPARTVARFWQVDRRVNMLIDLTFSSDIPLVY
jgi:hypothetical protein